MNSIGLPSKIVVAPLGKQRDASKAKTTPTRHKLLPYRTLGQMNFHPMYQVFLAGEPPWTESILSELEHAGYLKS
jgi:hypothetical protein